MMVKSKQYGTVSSASQHFSSPHCPPVSPTLSQLTYKMLHKRMQKQRYSVGAQVQQASYSGRAQALQ